MLPLWNFFLKKRQFTVLVMLALTLWGIAAASAITKESAPEVQIPVGVVTVALPGASAEEVERLVTNKIEEKLANLADLNTLTSTSREGLSVITAEFNASADIDASIQKLKDEVDKARAELPNDATDPSVTDVNFVDQPVQIISVSSDVPFAELARLGEALKSELQGLSGVSRVEVSGVRDREIQIVVKKEELARYGLSLSHVVSSITQSNASLPVGSIVVRDVAYAISFEGGLDEVRDLEGLAITSAYGVPVYLRDIATVSDGVEKARAYTRISSQGAPSEQALTLSVYKVRGEDVTRTTALVRERIETLQQGLLSGSQVIITNDAGAEVQKDLTQLTRTGIETVILVMLSLFLTIGWRESIIAGLSIPLSFLIAFIGLLYSGNTINFVSLFSLILAIGILVDSGIVVVEAIHTRVRAFGDKEAAAREALREYAWPLIGGTLTTVAVFLPLFFISGIVGKFIASIPFTVIFVLMASIFVALGLVPTLVLMFSSNKGHSRLMDLQEEYAEASRQWYAEKLTRFLENRRAQNRFLAAIGIGFIVALSTPVFGLVPVSFFPQGDIDFLYVDIEMPPGTPLEQTDLAARIVEEALYTTPGIESMVTTVGATSAFGNAPASDPRFANLTINLPDERVLTSTEMVNEVRARLAPITAADIRVGQPSGGPPVGAAVLVKFTGVNRADLEKAAETGRAVLTKTPGAITIDSSNKNDGIEFVLRIDRAKLADAGLSPALLASTLRTAVSGTTATKLTGGSSDVDVVVSLNLNPHAVDPHEASHVSLDALRQIPIPTASGAQVLLGSFLTEDIRRSTAAVVHEDRKRLLTVTSDVAPDTTVAEVVAAFKERMAKEQLPEGIEMTIGGENEETNKSFAEMGYALLAGLALMFVILVLSFDSYRFSAYLLLTVPLSLIGVFAGLALMGQALSFPSLLGVIALSGVIINHAIILMDSIIQRLAVSAGRPFKDIVVESATTRLRPIFLTTITTVLGMIPLTHASELWAPLAYAILFGLTFAMILTLVFIPLLVYRYPGRRMRERFSVTV